MPVLLCLSCVEAIGAGDVETDTTSVLDPAGQGALFAKILHVERYEDTALCVPHVLDEEGVNAGQVGSGV